MKAIISNIQRFSIHDGPGARTTIFFKGCPLRCKWCHNPETYQFGQELRYKSVSCIGCKCCVTVCDGHALSLTGAGLCYDASVCKKCFACVEHCPSKALTVSGQVMSLEEVLEEALRDREIAKRTGGGVTLSGGEATAQHEFCLMLLSRLRELGIHTALDTCGFCPTDRFKILVQATDLVLFDLKAADSILHRALTGVGNELILENLYCSEKWGTPVEIRIPFIPGMNDNEENIRQTAALLRPLSHITRIVLLGYHKLGLSKIYQFDQHIEDLHIQPPTKLDLEEAARNLQELCGHTVVYR